jgi:hypothetical protein
MSTLRDIALIILAIEGAIITLILLALLAGANYGLFRSQWWHRLPRWFALVRAYLDMGRGTVERVSRAIVSPVFKAETTRASFSVWVHRLLNKE